MAKGTYVVRKNGIEIARTENLITTAGKRLILQYLAEYVGSMSGAIAIGAGDTTPTVADTDMEYEFDRAEVLVRSADYDNSKITFIATLPQTTEGIITELGMWSALQNPDAGSYQSEMVLVCDSDVEDWSGTFNWDQTNFRVGSEALALIGGDMVTLDGANIDLSGYSNNDQFALLYFGGLATTLTMSFVDVDGNKNTHVVPVGNSGKNIARFTKANFTGTADWSTITSVELTTNGSLVVDSLRINDTDSYAPDYALVSHALLPEPFTKDTTSDYEISYTIGFGIA